MKLNICMGLDAHDGQRMKSHSASELLKNIGEFWPKATKGNRNY